MANKLFSLLKKHGPRRSSYLVDKLVKSGGSKDAARKAISRAGGKVKKLSYLNLPHNESFIYLEEQFGTHVYWSNLLDALCESNSTYGAAVSGIMARGGCIPKACFSTISGAPIAQKKHKSVEVVLKQLLSSGIVSIVSDEEFGECIQVTPFLLDSSIAEMKARLITEEVTILAVKEWAKKLNLASYNKIETRKMFKLERPKFGTANWDLVGPSYLLPLKSLSSKHEIRPGFLVCDVISNSLNEHEVLFFDKKCRLQSSLNNSANFLPILLALSFDPKAFNKLKSRGYIAALPDQLFGKEVGKALRALLETLTDAGKIAASDPNKLSELFSTLGAIEGAAANLRGSLFEHIVGYLVKNKLDGSIEIGKEIIDHSSGLRREVDVRRYKKDEFCHFYECKGYLATKTENIEEVRKWLEHKVPIIFSSFSSRPSYENARFEFSYWTTGKLDKETIELLDTANSESSEFTISWKHENEVLEFSKGGDTKSIKDTLNEHYYKNPVNFHKIRKRLAPS